MAGANNMPPASGLPAPVSGVPGKELIEQAGQKLAQAQRILVVSHIRPDGDAVGSLLGLGLALQTVGKEVQMVLEDGVPGAFRHLVGSDQVLSAPSGDFDLVTVVDCSDLQRTGSALKDQKQPDLNIDHHITNVQFAGINLVDTTAVATTEILAGFLPLWGLPLTQEVAAALLSGLITDTLGFRTSNMQPKALRTAAMLMEQGADLPRLYQRALVERSFVAVKYWGYGLSRLEREDGLIWTSLTLQDRRTAHYPGRDDADLVNVLSSVEEANIAVIFIEQSKDRVKVSWRSRPGYDVSQIALSFGGGGHPAASGAEIPGELEEVRKKVIEATQQLAQNPLELETEGNSAY